MAKSSKVIKDFSGGIASGVDPSNLQDNQLVKSTGLVSRGPGKLGIIPKTDVFSTSSINSNIPDEGGKNIHAWSSDMEISVAGQPNNIMTAPTATEKLKPMRSRLRIYMSKISDADTQLDLKIKVDGDTVLDFYFTPRTVDNYLNEGSPISRIGTGGSDTEAVDIAHYRTISCLDALAYTIAQTNSSYPSDQPVQIEPTTTFSSNTHAITTPMYYGSNGNAFYVTRYTGLTGTSWGSGDKYSIDLYWEQYAHLDIQLSGTLVSKSGSLKCMGDNSIISATNSNGSRDDFSAEDSISFHSFTSSEKISDFSTGGSFMYVYPRRSTTDYYGQGSRWEYNLGNISSSTEIATYGATIKVYTNFARSSSTDYSITYQSSLNDTQEQILDGIFGQLDNKIPEDYKIDVQNSSVGKRLLQQGFNTSKPYGFEVTATKTGATTISTLGSGRKFQHLLAVGGEHSQAYVYSMENDNWLTYPIDLRNTSNLTTDNTVKLSFVDAEGYLRVSDSTFMTDNKPKWFGYFNSDKTYENTTLSTNAGFYYADMAPTPYGYDADNNIIGVNAIAGQATHICDIAHSMMKYTTDEQTVNLNIPKYTNTSRGYMPHPQGIKMWHCFIDGTTSSQSPTNKLEGTFTKQETVEFYWTYVYEGGYVSQPTRFRQYHTDNNLRNEHQSSQTVVDGCALGIGLSVGKQLLDGNGTTQSNVRLNGIEIWGRFKKTDPNNLYLLMEVDLNKGWRSPVTGEWQALHNITDGSNIQQYVTQVDNTTQPIATTPIFIAPPTGVSHTFYTKYGVSWDKPIGFDSGGTGFKTACVFERRAYYGNIAIKGDDGLIHKYPDGIVKSLAGKYDTFCIDNLIEATVNDGDEITCLKVVGNKLCQFKVNSLTIMGIKILENGQTRENIEQIIHHVGIKNDNQVCETPFGLFWVSRSGAYLYNGSELNNITNNSQGSIIDKSTWESFHGEKTHCGYDAYWNQVHICKEQKNNDKTMIYDFNTGSFSESDGMYNGSLKTGFVNDRHGHLLWAEIPASVPSSNITGNSGSSPANQNNTATTSTPQNSSE